MIQTIPILPGVTLRCHSDNRFKQGCLSVQFVRLMHREEAALNALLPAVLLRGTKEYPDLRAITLRLDDLYGASVSALVRRVGDYQTTGLYCAFMEERLAFDGDEILKPMVDFLGQLLFDPVTEDGGFSREFVQSEKKNLISAIEAERNDKRAYAGAQLLKAMCREDSFGIPRLGEKHRVEQIDPVGLYRHYRKILAESPVELFYVGSASAEQVAALLRAMLGTLQRAYVPLPAQTAFHDTEPSHQTEQMEVAQGKLCMGFVTPITNRSPEFPAMQVLNTLYGAGMTSKLFMNVRERLSLCYSVGSGYHGSKGIMTVAAGIDTANEEKTRSEILAQLDFCRQGKITAEELDAAKEAILSGLRAVTDSPGALESFCSTAAIGGFRLSVAEYMTAVEQVTLEQVVAAANTVKLHSTFFLKGVTQ